MFCKPVILHPILQLSNNHPLRLLKRPHYLSEPKRHKILDTQGTYRLFSNKIPCLTSRDIYYATNVINQYFFSCSCSPKYSISHTFISKAPATYSIASLPIPSPNHLSLTIKVSQVAAYTQPDVRLCKWLHSQVFYISSRFSSCWTRTWGSTSIHPHYTSFHPSLLFFKTIANKGGCYLSQMSILLMSRA